MRKSSGPRVSALAAGDGVVDAAEATRAKAAEVISFPVREDIRDDILRAAS